MRTIRLLLIPVVALALGVVASCAGDDDNEDHVDAGTTTDAGTRGEPDAGLSSDAGLDSGTGGGEPDAGFDVDAGTDAGTVGEPDAGSDVDAGMDAGTDVDAGTELDAGADLDAGTDLDAGADVDAGTDAGTYPGPSPAATCPTGAILCESFSNGLNGWTPSAEHATITAENGWLHILTEDGVDERTAQERAIALWQKPIPAFETQLFIRAHVFMRALPAVLDQVGTLFVLANLVEQDFGGIELQVLSDTAFARDDWTGRPGAVWHRQPEPVTVGMFAGRWVCLEWEIRRDTASSIQGNARVYVDGTLAHDFNPTGMRAFSNFIVGYGFVHPKGPSGSETFIDNVAVSSIQRIGCQ